MPFSSSSRHRSGSPRLNNATDTGNDIVGYDEIDIEGNMGYPHGRLIPYTTIISGLRNW
jgi:hypothetical protein